MNEKIAITVLYISHYLIALYIVILVIKNIVDDLKAVNSSNNTDMSPFEVDSEKQRSRIQNLGLSKFSAVGAAVLPLLLLTVIFLMVPDSFLELLKKYLEQKEIPTMLGGAIMAIISFYIGSIFARKFLKAGEDDDFNDTDDMNVMESRIRKVEICYLSTTFFIIVFNFLNFEVEFNILKGMVTTFVAGNIYYVVFRRKSKMPSFKEFLDNMKVNSKTN